MPRNIGVPKRIGVLKDVGNEAHGHFHHSNAGPLAELNHDMTQWWKLMRNIIIRFLLVSLVIGLGIWFAFARDDGRFGDSPLKPWFDKLKSGKGLCCSFADGVSIADVDWDTRGGHYRVRLNGKWIDVPETALVSEPNRYGAAVVWPYQDMENVTQIRCFMPGAGT